METLSSMFHNEILENTVIVKLQYLRKEISKSQLEWHLGHAKYLEGIRDKIFGKA